MTAILCATATTNVHGPPGEGLPRRDGLGGGGGEGRRQGEEDVAAATGQTAGSAIDSITRSQEHGPIGGSENTVITVACSSFSFLN